MGYTLLSLAHGPYKCAQPLSIPGNPGAPDDPDGPYNPEVIQGKVIPVNGNMYAFGQSTESGNIPSQHAPVLPFHLAG